MLDEPQSEKEREAIRRGTRFSVAVFAVCLTLVILVAIALVVLSVLNSGE